MQSRNVNQYSLEGIFIKTWESAAHAEVGTGVPASNIHKVCKKKKERNQAGGFKWSYDGEAPQIEIKHVESSGYDKFYEESKHYNLEKGTVNSTVVLDYEPKDDIELAKLHKVDLSKYKIANYYSKLRPDGRFTSTVFASLKKGTDINKEDVLDFLKSYKSDYQPFKVADLLINNVGEKCCAFISITDFHLDKRELRERTPEERVKEYFTVLENLTRRSYQSYNIDEIAFVIGSDMLHTDNIWNSTTKGTPQEITLRWNESFVMAFDIYAKSIRHLKQFCNKLKIILVAGNHSLTKEFYLSFALQKYFENDKNIEFDSSPVPRKIYTYGVTFIGLHHGNTKLIDLPIVFAKEFCEEWGKHKYHEIKVGDQHHYMEKDYKGVLIKQLPALTDADTWHNNSNYINSVRAAHCTIYDYEKGRVADIQERN